MNAHKTSPTVPAVNVTDAREARSKFWIAAYSRPRSEKKVAKQLSELGLEIYLPIQKQIRQWSDRKKLVEVVVIPMVVFIFLEEKDIETIKKNALIIRVLSLPGDKKGYKIPSPQIEKLKYILGQTEMPVEFDTTAFAINQNVRIIRGHFIGMIGEIRHSTPDSAEVILGIDGLGGAKLNIKKSDLEILS